MLSRWFCVGLCTTLLLQPVAAAPSKPAKPADDLALRMADLIKAGFIELACPVPVMLPTVAPLKRSASVPNRGELVERFFGGDKGVTSTEQTRSPIYGRGTRLKSGKVLYLTDSGSNARQPQTSHEYIAAFLDLYDSGYVYQNNVPHAPVYATDVRIKTSTSADVSRFNVYSETDGQRAVEQLLTSLKGGLQVPSGFQTAVQTAIQDYGEKLFVYRINPEYIATVEILRPDGTKQEVRTGIPLHDVFVSVQLDGDKLLAGMEYFWDNSITVSGSPKRGMAAQEAFMAAKTGLLKHFNNQPPMMTVSNIKLGYIIDRKDRNTLVPCWVFDASYNQGESRPDPSTGNYRSGLIPVAVPFAVNCLTGEFHALWQ